MLAPHFFIKLGIPLSLFILVFAYLNADFPGGPAEFPADHPPDDPKYKHQWQLLSYLPAGHQGNISPIEAHRGSGMAVDKAWQYHLGDPSTVIAILDSGIIWKKSDFPKYYFLNRGELPLPEESETFDKNGDGAFSIADYEGDSRVFDKNLNGILDPGDLILIFQNGIDEDQNGYTDDIAGWDFYEGDNNPHDRLYFRHGTHGAIYAAGETNNGVGKAGICGECSVVALRVSDSFIVDGNHFAEAVYYASKMKFDVLHAAIGTTNYNSSLKSALSYAQQSNVVIVGSAADENSYHHNFPALFDPIIYPNALRYDTAEMKNATTFTNFNNCSNYGARVDVSVSALHCSSEATGNLTGILALVKSYGKKLNLNLKVGEIISLMKNSTFDINKGREALQKGQHPTWPGWDTMSGYGLVNAGQMMKTLSQKAIPPAVRIKSPKWFAPLQNKSFPIPIEVQVENPRHPPFDIELSIRKGVESEDFPFKKLAMNEHITQAFLGVLHQLTTSDLVGLETGQHDHSRNKWAYTLKVKVTDAKGITAETRRTFFIFEDPFLLKGYPIKLDGSGESSGFFMDLDKDGKEEYITADGEGLIHAFTQVGNELTGFPRKVDRFLLPKTIYSPIAGGDLNLDGHPEIVAVTADGLLSVITHQGKVAKGFPINLPFQPYSAVSPSNPTGKGVLCSPVLSDLNGDGNKEIIIMGLDGYIYVYNMDGKPHPGFPVAITINNQRAKLLSSPSIFDLNKDGIKDLVFGTNHQGSYAGYVFALNGLGQKAARLNLAGFPSRIPILQDQIFPTIGTGIPASPVIANLLGDEEKEILIHPFLGKAYILNLQGKIIKSLSLKMGTQLAGNDDYMMVGFGHPSLADIEGKGVLNPVIPGVGNGILVNALLGGKRYDYHHLVGAWNAASGKMLSSFPKINEDIQLSQSAIHLDLNTNGEESVIIGSGGYFLHAFDRHGEADGFPHFTGGWILSSPSAGDIDGDGKIEVAVTTREGYLFIWRTNGQKSTKNSWKTFKGNPARTGTL